MYESLTRCDEAAADWFIGLLLPSTTAVIDNFDARHPSMARHSVGISYSDCDSVDCRVAYCSMASCRKTNRSRKWISVVGYWAERWGFRPVRMRQSQCLYVDVNNQRICAACKYFISHCYYSFTGIRTVCVLTRDYTVLCRKLYKTSNTAKVNSSKKTVKIKTFLNYDTIR